MSMCGYCTTPQACAANGCAYLANRAPHDLDARALKARLDEAERVIEWQNKHWRKIADRLKASDWRNAKLEAVAETARTAVNATSMSFLDPLRDALAALDAPVTHDGDGDGDAD